MSYMTCCVLGQEKNKMHGYHCSARRTQHPKCILNETFSLMGGVGGTREPFPGSHLLRQRLRFPGCRDWIANPPFPSLICPNHAALLTAGRASQEAVYSAKWEKTNIT